MYSTISYSSSIMQIKGKLVLYHYHIRIKPSYEAAVVIEHRL